MSQRQDTLPYPKSRHSVDKEKKSFLPIEDYGIVGNLHTVALISTHGSIDFMSFTRFDSPTIFAAMLDPEKGGSFEILPLLNDVNYKQLYLPDTTVLLTRFLSTEGVAELTDFMPVKEEETNCALVRRLKVIKGSITFRIKCSPKFDYARAEHRTHGSGEEVVFESMGNDKTTFRLMSNIPLINENGEAFAEFTLHEKETADFVLEAIPNRNKRGKTINHYVNNTFYSTIHYWQNWISKCSYTGRWREMVHRSALTLKLLTSYKYGSVIAAPTFGLPECISGKRNWDYRYCWIRDAAFTMYAFLKLGFMDEAHAFFKWLKDLSEKTHGPAELHLMYAVDGTNNLEEKELNHLVGYKNSRPVRVGNAAFKQFQLDIYGELIDTVYLYNKYGGAITYEFWQLIEQHIYFVCENWKKPDHGIWEIRDTEKEFLHSRLMCWVAIDRALKIAELRSFPAPIHDWRNVRNEIYKDIYFNFWNEEKKAFVQYKGSNVVDASTLLMPLVRFISPIEPRWISTLQAIEKELTSDALVNRYSLEAGARDGLEGDEGSFTMCSFWYVECLAKSGQVDKARVYFEKMLGYSNHLGLYAEQLGQRGEHLGNYPQAFTHLGLISAAYELDKILSKTPDY